MAAAKRMTRGCQGTYSGHPVCNFKICSVPLGPSIQQHNTDGWQVEDDVPSFLVLLFLCSSFDKRKHFDGD